MWPRWIVLETAQGKEPPLGLFVLAQDSLLILERVAEILEHKDKERGDDEGLVESTDRIVVDSLADINEREPRGDGINGYHKQHPYNVSLLVWLRWE